MKRAFSIASLLVALALLLAAPGAGAAEPEWHSEQPVAAGIDVPVPLGQIGGMAFWSPNKGVLITAGNSGMPAGVYAYDGSGWYLYSTVCGGLEGDIAISGPDEFWTISEYGEAQEGIQSDGARERSRTLCHFANGEVVKSYAEPAVTGFYLPMSTAACEEPADCWFAGEAFPDTDPNEDPFHLHWDGNSVTPVPSMTASEPGVASMPGNAEGLAFAQGRLFEAAGKAPFLREVSLVDPQRFLPVETPIGADGPYVLSTDPFQQELWAGSEAGAVIRLGVAGFETVLPPGAHFERSSELISAIGVEPDTGSAWVAGGEEEVRDVTVEGGLGPAVHLPQAAEELNGYGNVSSLECPGPGQCWAATESGWLFHFGGTPAEGVNTDPLMHRLITFRPSDASSRHSLVEAGLPPDDSGELESKKEEPHFRTEFPGTRKPKRLVTDIKQKVIDKTVLQLAFTLHGKAHVRLLAKHHKAVVAKTAPLTMAKGRHKLHLRLDPKRWPTSLDFQVHAVAKTSAR
ncbi:MAG TPA: hypothetical protein VGC32_12450 [Solirubrobacterales bacterium]